MRWGLLKNAAANAGPFLGSVLAILVLGWWGGAFVSGASAEEKNLEIFIDGKRYDSMSDYKQYKINRMREEAMVEEGSSDGSAGQVSQDGDTKSSEMTADDLREQGLPPDNPVADAAEMQRILNRALHPDSDPSAGDGPRLTVDPSKIKTITLVPKAKETPARKPLTELLGEYLRRILEDLNNQAAVKHPTQQVPEAVQIVENKTARSFLQKLGTSPETGNPVPVSSQPKETSANKPSYPILSTEDLEEIVQELAERKKGRLTKDYASGLPQIPEIPKVSEAPVAEPEEKSPDKFNVEEQKVSLAMMREVLKGPDTAPSESVPVLPATTSQGMANLSPRKEEPKFDLAMMREALKGPDTAPSESVPVLPAVTNQVMANLSSRKEEPKFDLAAMREALKGPSPVPSERTFVLPLKAAEKPEELFAAPKEEQKFNLAIMREVLKGPAAGPSKEPSGLLDAIQGKSSLTPAPEAAPLGDFKKEEQKFDLAIMREVLKGPVTVSSNDSSSLLAALESKKAKTSLAEEKKTETKKPSAAKTGEDKELQRMVQKFNERKRRLLDKDREELLAASRPKVASISVKPKASAPQTSGYQYDDELPPIIIDRGMSPSSSGPNPVYIRNLRDLETTLEFNGK